ncbi:MAG TPA: MoaD/ThiS family protein [Gaiellaceae bacterium]|nr:MoaD/ThiS family protein [Gaiellaceae bacterium]
MKVVLSGTLQRYADYRREHDVPAATLGEGLSELVERLPNLSPVLYDDDGSVRSTHAIFVNGEQVVGSDLQRPVNNWDEVEIITALAGG